MRHILLILLSLSTFNSIIGQTLTGSLQHDGLLRNYRIHLPPNFDKSKQMPLVFNFHGYGSNSLEQEFYSGMNAVADTEGFLVCYPDGIGKAWNVGWNFGSTADDIGFTETMIDEFVKLYGINPKKVYSCGMSNGGFFSYILACNLNSKIAAIASVTGSMTPTGTTTCQPNKEIPILEIHGTADGTVNYDGTPLVSTSISNVLQFWQQNNGCDLIPVIETLPNTNTTDGTTAEKWTYQHCTDNKKLVHFKIENGGHTWPGSFINIGTTCQDFNASVEIWNFFKEYDLATISIIGDSYDELSIYPNPFEDQIQIYKGRNDVVGTISICDMSGKLLVLNPLLDDITNFDTSHLQAGMYVLTIKSSQTTKNFKILKL